MFNKPRRDPEGKPLSVRRVSLLQLGRHAGRVKWLMAQKGKFFERLVHKKLVPEVAKNTKIDWRNPRVVCRGSVQQV
jgi:hypothetical protein